MNESFMAIWPTLGTRYQQDWPRRVIDESIMSSETRKKAWSYKWKGENGENEETEGGTHELDAPSEHGSL